MVSTKHINVDDVWDALGRCGRYQIYQLLVITVSSLPQAFHLLSVVFVGRDIEHVCNTPSDGEEQHNSYVNLSVTECAVLRGNVTGGDVYEERCTSYNYSQPKDRSYISEWDLVCDREHFGRLVQMMVMVGMLFGGLVLPPLGDRFGRKTLHVSANIAMFAVVMAMAFVTNFTGFLVLKFLIGFLTQGYSAPILIITIELFPTSLRTLLGFYCSVLWSFSIMCITPIAYWTSDSSWRLTQIVMASFSAFALLEIWLMDESLRWLVANDKHKRAEDIIKKAAKMNGKNPESVFLSVQHKPVESMQMVLGPENDKEKTDPFLQEADDPLMNTEAETKIRIIDLIAEKTLRKITIIVCCSWITNSLTYYGLTLLSSRLAGNTYINFFLGALLEIPSYGLLWMLFRRVGRKKTCIFFHLVAGFALLAAVLVSALAGHTRAGAICQTVFSLLGRFAISGSYAAIWLYTPELYPTNCRSLGLGVASSLARLGSMTSPFFKSLANIAVWAPGAIFSIACITVTGLILLLPETSGRELPQTLDELKRWEKQKGEKGK